MARKVMVIPANPTGGSKGPITGKKIRVAAYCRVSTDHEEQEGSFKNQVDYYTKLIEKTVGWELAGIFADDGISGTGTKKRSGFMEMIAACEEGRVDLVITDQPICPQHAGFAQLQSEVERSGHPHHLREGKREHDGVIRGINVHDPLVAGSGGEQEHFGEHRVGHPV